MGLQSNVWLGHGNISISSVVKSYVKFVDVYALLVNYLTHVYSIGIIVWLGLNIVVVKEIMNLTHL